MQQHHQPHPGNPRCDPEKLRALASWYRAAAEQKSNPMIREGLLSRAADLDKEAKRLHERVHESHSLSLCLPVPGVGQRLVKSAKSSTSLDVARCSDSVTSRDAPTGQVFSPPRPQLQRNSLPENSATEATRDYDPVEDRTSHEGGNVRERTRVGGQMWVSRRRFGIGISRIEFSASSLLSCVDSSTSDSNRGREWDAPQRGDHGMLNVTALYLQLSH